ncbi:serine/threonine-protein kinase [Streptomyces bacillaris]|uniref:serine/threonine-protein kinase n=1 Tax=Streptomyces bacillaris TaxID=68179 RepID=UPI0038283984
MSDPGRLVLGRYRLVEQVGRGGMGTVWRAEDEVLGRQVAVKRLHVPPYLSDDEIRTLYERTRREARSAARISHPHVIVVHDVVDDEGLPCIVMEYVPSVTLGDVLKSRGLLDPREAARIGSAMAAALRAAHAAGVLHRDVKPANVLLGDDGRIVLTDFGIAVEPGTPSLTRTGELVGSVHYLAPERLRNGMAEPGPASDLWSLGATLYQAVEGCSPFQRATAVETAYAIATDPYDPPRRAGDLAPVIEGLLVKDPAERMDADRAALLLDRAAGTENTGAAGTGTGSADDQPTRRERTRVLASAPPASASLSGLSGRGDEPPATARKGGRRRRTAWWSAVAVAALTATVTAGVAMWPRSDAPSGNAAPPKTGASHRTPEPSASPQPPVPAGYRLKEAHQGLLVPVREDWTLQDRPGNEVAYIDPTGLAGLRINVATFAAADPLRHWRDTEEAQTRRDNPGYERVRMDETTFRGQRAGYWEFTFKGRVRDFRAAELAFTSSDGTQYVVYLSAPSARWDEFRPAFDAAVNGIRLPE